jgi:nicotinate-nucleotide pyrophosphorylase
MTTGAGTHAIRIENAVEGRSFDLITSPVPATSFQFHCEVALVPAGSRVSQGVTMSGLLGPVFSVLMGNRIASSFEPILAGLAKAAEDSVQR